MARFAENRKLYGSNSRVTRKSRGTETAVSVMSMVSETKTGHFLTNRKSEMREPAGRIVPRKLVPMELLFETPEEQFMYIEFCKAAGK